MLQGSHFIHKFTVTSMTLHRHTPQVRIMPAATVELLFDYDTQIHP
jgi:hypothetical protein